jgi:hypothetical protein
LDNREQNTKTGELGGSYGVMDIVIAATPQLFSAQVSEQKRQLYLLMLFYKQFTQNYIY